MKYEQPNIEIVMLEKLDVITLSVDKNGSGDNVTGGW